MLEQPPHASARYRKTASRTRDLLISHRVRVELLAAIAERNVCKGSRRISRRLYRSLDPDPVRLSVFSVPRMGCDEGSHPNSALAIIFWAFIIVTRRSGRICGLRFNRELALGLAKLFAPIARPARGQEILDLRESGRRDGPCSAAEGARYQTGADPYSHRFCRPRRVRPRHSAAALLRACALTPRRSR